MRFFTLLFALCFTTPLCAQILENRGFEDWEQDDGKDEPAEWSSLKTATPDGLAGLSPNVIEESSDAHTGAKSILLENRKPIGFPQTVPGIATNGRLQVSLEADESYAFTDTSNAKWHTPINTRPDSLVGWYKYSPEGQDTGLVVAILHRGWAKLPDPDSTNFVAFTRFAFGAAAEWTRFSVPWGYLNDSIPEYCLITLSSGNGVMAEKGSVALFDDLEIITNPVVNVRPELDTPDLKVYGSYQAINFERQNQLTASMHIRIFDTTGREVRRVRYEHYGRKQVLMPNPGIYFCLIEVDGHQFTKKVMVY